MLQEGSSATINDVLFTGTSATDAKAHSQADTSGKYPAILKTVGKTVYLTENNAGFKPIGEEWTDAAAYLKEHVFPETDKYLQGEHALRTQFDALPDNPEGAGKKLDGVILSFQADGHISARSEHDTDGANTATIEHYRDFLLVKHLTGGQGSANTWQQAVSILKSQLDSKNADVQGLKHLQTTFVSD